MLKEKTTLLNSRNIEAIGNSKSSLVHDDEWNYCLIVHSETFAFVSWLESCSSLYFQVSRLEPRVAHQCVRENKQTNKLLDTKAITFLFLAVVQ